MTLAVLYCKGEQLGVTEITKRATGYSTQQFASLSERLLQAAKDIQALNEAAMPGGVTLWKLIRVLGGGELLEKTLAPVLPSEQLDFELTRLPVILAAYSVFLKSWPHPTYRALMSSATLAGSSSWPSSSCMSKRCGTCKLESNRGDSYAAVHFALSEPKAVSTDVESLRLGVEAFQRESPKSTRDIKNWAETQLVLAARHTA